jgi:hypothetical protein
MVGGSMPKEDVARLRKLATDSADALGGAAAWSFSADPKAKPPFRVRRVDTIRDKQKLNDVLDEATKFVNEGTLTEVAKKFGIKVQVTFQRNVETYKDVPIDAAGIVIQPVDVNAPQAQMMKSMLGGGFHLRMALVNDLWLTAMSADPDQEIHTLIDQAKSGSPGQVPSEVQAALQLVPEAKNASAFGTYNVARWLQLVMSFLPMPMAMPQTEIPAGSNIAFDAIIGGARLLTDIAVPKQQVETLMNMFTSMKKQQMEQQKQSGPPPAKKPGQA